MENLYRLLSQNQVFAHLSDAQRKQVVDRSITRRCAKDGNLALYGEVWPYFFMVGEGRVSAVKESSEGRRLVVLNLKPGDILWGLAFYLEDAPMPVTLTAYDDCCIYLWSRDSLLPVLLENGHVLWELARLMVVRMQHASELVEGLAFQSVTGRVARLVLDLFGDTVGTPVTRGMTLEEMAAMVGTTREVVCRTLYRLAQEDLIQITRTEFILTDRDGLEELVEQP